MVKKIWDGCILKRNFTISFTILLLIDLVKLFKSTNNNPSAKVIRHEGLLDIGAITQEEIDAKKK